MKIDQSKQIAKLKPQRQYKIKWIDSRHYGEWHDKDATQKVVLRNEKLIETYGFFLGISEDGEFLTFTQSIEQDNGSTANKIKIPVCAVVEVEDQVTHEVFKIVAMTLIALIAGLIAVDQLVRNQAVFEYLESKNISIPQLQVEIIEYNYDRQ